MRVALAWPYDGHAPDEEVDLPPVVARRLIADGRARLVDDPPAAATGDQEAPLTTDPNKEPHDG